MLSIVVPTYKEADNIRTLIEGIDEHLNGVDYEVLVVDDDSPDGTADRVEELSERYPVRVIVRKGERGLSSAVLRGIAEAKSDVVGVMDADLSHHPEYLPKMLEALAEYDVVVGSRLTKGGGIELWPWYRKVISEGARMLALPLTKVRDCMSGYFMFKKEVLEGVELNPIGYKILLELLVKGNYRSVKEVPIVFRNRAVGKSKMGAGTYIEYLTHLSRLYVYRLAR